MTDWITVRPQALLPGFDAQGEPAPGDYWVDDLADIDEDAYAQAHDAWTRINGYVRLHEMLPPRWQQAYAMTDKARLWAEKIMDGATPTNLVLTGSVGVGKSYASGAVGCYLAAFWEPCRRVVDVPGVKMVGFSDLLLAMKGFDDKSAAEGRNQLYREVISSPVLVIDDLVRSKLSDFDTERLTSIMDRRMENFLPTIASSNVMSKKDIAALVGEKLASRLLGGCTFQLIVGADRRQLVNQGAI